MGAVGIRLTADGTVAHIATFATAVEIAAVSAAAMVEIPRVAVVVMSVLPTSDMSRTTPM